MGEGKNGVVARRRREESLFVGLRVSIVFLLREVDDMDDDFYR